jgi:hypothetical protein
MKALAAFDTWVSQPAGAFHSERSKPVFPKQTPALDSGDPTPEAPRTIFDVLGTIQRLPLHLEAKGEFEYVGTKPLGTGCDTANLSAECTGTPVKELRGAVARPFLNGRLIAGVNFLVASGYTGQTPENFYPSTIQEVVGVRIPSYASITLTYRVGRVGAP